MEYRPYQHQAAEAIWKEISIGSTALIVASTGLGKTEIIKLLIEKSIRLYPQFRCIFLVNKLNLLHQTAKRLERYFNCGVGVYYGKTKSLVNPITVASIQSVYDKEINCNMLIMDEVHNFNQDEGRYLTLINKMMSINPKTKLVGCTATPFRSDGYIYGKDKFFKGSCFTRDLKWAIDNKFLVPPTCKHMDHAFDPKNVKITAGDYNLKQLEKLANDDIKIIKQVSDALSRLSGRKKTVWSCVSIAHAEKVNKFINDAGEKSVVVHSKQGDRSSLELFEAGDCKHLVFVSIVSEGYDYPPIDSVVLMRPTRSANLYVQTIGRGLRLYEGKKDCLVLDYGRVIENCGPVHDPWIGSKKKSAIESLDHGMRFCPECLEYCEKSDDNCPVCHYLFEKQKRDYSKNLTNTPYSDGLLFKKKTTFIIKEVVSKAYMTKKGTIAEKLEYHTNGVFKDVITEFFGAKNSYYYKQRINLFQEGKRYEIDCEKNGKWWVTKEIRISNTIGNPTLLKL
jgi:DNA repair protein RadD